MTALPSEVPFPTLRIMFHSIQYPSLLLCQNTWLPIDVQLAADDKQDVAFILLNVLQMTVWVSLVERRSGLGCPRIDGPVVTKAQ
jgi:hypothetical protein